MKLKLKFKYFLLAIICVMAILVFVIGIVSRGIQANDSTSAIAPSHEIFNELLIKNVTNEGMVNYLGFIADSIKCSQHPVDAGLFLERSINGPGFPSACVQLLDGAEFGVG